MIFKNLFNRWRISSKIPWRPAKANVSTTWAPTLTMTEPPASLDTMPRPANMCPFFGSALQTMARYQFSNGHRMVVERVKALGKVYYDKIFNFKSVYVASPAATAAVYRTDGTHPCRPEFTAWKYPREKMGIPLGITLADGDLWYASRRAMDKQLMVFKNLYRYVPVMDEIAGDYIKILLQNQENNKESGGYIHDLKHEQFRWSLETTCQFLYDKRIGCLRNDVAPRPDLIKFAKAIDVMFQTSHVLSVMSTMTARIFAPIKFYQHNKAWSTIFDIGRKAVDEKVAELRKAEAEGRVEEAIEKGGFLMSLLDEASRERNRGGKMTMEQIYTNVTELMGAGVDTTSTTMQWLFHLLALNPDKQERLRAEIPPGKGPITADFLVRAKYLKACIKESLRIRPALIGTSRILPTDAILNGYAVPKGTNINLLDYVMSTNEENFPNAHKFMPERWMEEEGVVRKSKQSDDRRFASLPFGFGPRMCVGRRLAEMQLFLLTSRVVRDYHIIDMNGGKLIEPSTRLLLMPSEPVKIRLEKRV